MRLKFLLDENILYHAIRGVDKQNNPDPAAANLLKAIREICHVIFVHPKLIEKYQAALKKLHEDPPRSEEAINFVKQFLYNNLKRAIDYSDISPLPPDVRIPHEDLEIVRAALISKPVFVTADDELRDAINNHHEKLGLKVLDVGEALALAESEIP